MSTDNETKHVSIKCIGNGEKISVTRLLSAIEQMDGKELETLTGLMSHEVNEAKDALRRSNI
mgnify:CR=1 FL=1